MRIERLLVSVITVQFEASSELHALHHGDSFYIRAVDGLPPSFKSLVQYRKLLSGGSDILARSGITPRQSSHSRFYLMPRFVRSRLLLALDRPSVAGVDTLCARRNMVRYYHPIIRWTCAPNCKLSNVFAFAYARPAEYSYSSVLLLGLELAHTSSTIRLDPFILGKLTNTIDVHLLLSPLLKG
ncbi:unnamed protein product [Cyclocybe aegerita]|uniref:Uncharacterized protein n=1 Tax=Cyclocybe aegerita TaxID=1973307 RepID=A0A8S0VZL9_CYCAE|nr:unnamed protein product [Cyclocybe aegerita]